MYDIYGKAKVTGNFGEKRSYYKPGKFHEGDDIALAMNSPINARAAGTIIGIKSDPNGYGNYVDIDHGNGIITRYAHANKFNVKPGQKVKEGEIIGLVGSTGRSSGPHLHTELIVNGKKQNPKELEKYMANVLKPKGTIGVPDIRGIEDLENQIAMAQVGGRQLSPEEEEMRKQSVAYFLNQLQNPVEMPRFTTIQDIFDAQKGDKLKVFGQYLTNNPDATRLLGSFLGGTYMDSKGDFVHGGDEEARRQEAMMQAAQQKALDQQKMQNNLAASAYGDILHQDIANMQDARARELAEQELNFKREENALDRQYRQQQLDAQIAHNKAMEDIATRKLDGLLTGGAAGVDGTNINNIKMTAAERKALTENKTTLANIDAGLKSLEKNKDAYTFWKGVLGSDIANRIDPKGIGTRTQIDNITAVYRKWLTGAQMSDKERKAYERFLPAPTDNYKIVKAKLKGMRGAVQRSNDAILSNYGINSGSNSDPLGLGL